MIKKLAIGKSKISLFC